jgi:hypothetical protein
MGETVSLSLWIYALAAAVAMLIAAIIKGLVWALNRVGSRARQAAAAHGGTPAAAARPAGAAAAAQRTPAAAADGTPPDAAVPLQAKAAIPPAHVAAITAALQAVLGGHRIVHIDDGSGASGWTAQGRAVHHGSHAVPQRGGRPR